MRGVLNSLRGRFLIAILLWVALGIGAIWFTSVRLFSAHVEAQYHEELEVHVRELAGLTVLDTAGNPHLARPLSDPRYAVALSGFYWQVTREGYGTLKSPSMTRGSLDHDIAHSPTILHRIENGPTGRTIVYGFVRPAPAGPPSQFVIATDERHLQRIVQSFTQELLPLLVLLASALLASGAAIITFGFRPLARLRSAIGDLRSGKSTHLAGSYPAEIMPVVTDLNAYAERNADIVARGRVQAGNLAHSLRTPLTIITDEAEQMIEAGEGQINAQIFLAESEKMQRQIDYHLARSRSGGSRSGLKTNAQLEQVLPPLLAAMRRLHPDKEFLVDPALKADVKFPCDPEDLSEILSNTLDNAGKWAAQTVTVCWSISGAAAELLITDDGPGLSSDQLEHAFSIGARFDVTKSGSGLGLAISRDIARDYGGDLELRCVQNGGLQAKLSFELIATA